MEERIHEALDGELDPTRLDPTERAELNALSEAIRTATDTYRALEAPDLTASVMTRVRQLDGPSPAGAASRGLRLVDWLWRPRPLVVAWRPAYAAAVAFAILGAGVWVGSRPSGTPPIGSLPVAEGNPAAQTAIYVQFRLDAPGASTVQVVGSFTDWIEPVELVETVPGVWSTLLPLDPGVHDYTFIVDGDLWVTDPLAPTVDDGFGGSKNRLFLTRPMENA